MLDMKVTWPEESTERKMTLEQAYLEWVKARPFQFTIAAREVTYIEYQQNNTRQDHMYTEPAHFDGNCCSNSHFYKNAIGDMVERPDEDVCKRERAWRVYVRLRDAEPEVSVH